MFLVLIQRRHVAYCYEQKDFWYVKNISNDEWFNLTKEIEGVFHFITLNTEMVERGISLSAVTKKDQHLIVPATFAFFHSEWYTHYHETGKSKACYQSGTRWCTSFRKNVNKTLATKTTYKKSGEKTLDILKGCHFLLHILGLQTSSI